MSRHGETELVVREVRQHSRYEALVGDAIAGVLKYEARGGVLTLTHTTVSHDFAGSGVGAALARSALDDARAAGRTVRPVCSFVAGWIRRHPEYGDLVADDLS